jgi:hypothetical protein
MTTSLVEKTLSPAHQNGLPPTHFGTPATLMPAVMHYPWRIPLFAGGTASTAGE